MADGTQAAYALVAAAFVTGIWAWITQRAKVENSDLNTESQERQFLVKEYRESNQQLYDQISKLWITVRELQGAVEECERKRIEDIKQFGELHKMLEQAQRAHLDDTNRIIELEQRMRRSGYI